MFSQDWRGDLILSDPELKHLFLCGEAISAVIRPSDKPTQNERATEVNIIYTHLLSATFAGLPL